jgi:DNA/RNA-binding domain of Phe-tRNA-synthetase-like protein
MILTTKWKSVYPGAMIGIIEMTGVVNTDPDSTLQKRASEVEASIKSNYAGYDRKQLLNLPALQVYADYYKRFDKTYHVLLQLESVLLKGKTIRGPSPIVLTMFLAEMKGLLLTAVHDLEKVKGELVVDVATGSERYTTMAGTDQILKAGDMFIRDDEGILSSIIYGPDQRTMIRQDSHKILFTVYAPAGIRKEDLEVHLQDLESNIHLFSPDARVADHAILATG